MSGIIDVIKLLKNVVDAADNVGGKIGSIQTLYELFKKGDHIDETMDAMRKRSKEAYIQYCNNRKYRESDLGIPLEDKIVGYWQSCLERNVIPGENDMVQCGIASAEEAKVMLPYLMEKWMTVPEFSQWLNGIISKSSLESISEKLKDLPKMIEALEKIENKLEMQSINGIATILTAAYINDAKCSCTDSKIKNYYMVDNRFDIMLSVISAGRDIPSPQAEQEIENSLEGGNPVIITGNGGQGKTSLMLKAAVKWVESGKPAIWLALSSGEEISKRQARDFYNSLIQLVPTGERLLLCIDNPYEGRRSLENLGRVWGDCEKIQLLMAERENRLTQLADPGSNLLINWVENSKLIVLRGVDQSRKYTLHDYPVSYSYFDEDAERRKKIIKKSTYFLVKEKAVRDKDRISTIEKILDKYGKQDVSIVELIYRTLFALKKIASKPGSIKLDWDEWGDLLKKEFECDWSYIDLYGVIAAFKIFNVPFTLSLFCKYFGFDEKKLKSKLRESFLQSHVEPVIFKKDTGELQTKHDVIAELFFSFNKRKVSIDDLILDLIDVMDESETEIFLKCIVENNKKEIKKGYKHLVGDIDYWSYMRKIYLRREKGSFNLLYRSKSYLCLGAIWAKKQKSEDKGILKAMLESTAPPVDNDILLAKLYTEWGIWAASKKNNKLAEEKFMKVIDNIPGQIHARTELGRLLSKQPGREGEAEKYLKEAIEIDPKNLHPHTELGRLLSKQPGREGEAENYLKEILKIDAKNIQTRTELGRLLSKQPGREVDAEKYLKKAIEINAKDIQSRTELGRLLSKQPGREGEAENYLKEILKIDAKNIQTRTELGRLLSKQPGREEEAENYLKEILKIDAKNIQTRTELGRLLSKQPGREVDAEKYLKKAIEIDPKNLHPHTELGRLLSKQPGREVDAENYLKEAIEIDPKNLPPKNVLAEMYEKLGRISEAKQLYQEILDIEPENEYGIKGLSRLK